MAPGPRGVDQRAEDPQCNELVLTGQLLKPAEIRTTPAGIPIARFVLVHRSRRREAGQMREVECRMSVIASGEALTAGIAGWSPGTRLQVKGFLSRAGYRAPDMRVELHALNIQQR
ncbi:MAG TPA: primosomal replication protein N [Gammaproteobacteria bacterium]|nr:primosomal replication protein N [Gammaproteobacteria bacterium]